MDFFFDHKYINLIFARIHTYKAMLDLNFLLYEFLSLQHSKLKKKQFFKKISSQDTFQIKNHNNWTGHI